MIVLKYRLADNVVVVRIDGKKVFYRDSFIIKEERRMETLLKDKELDKWVKGMDKVCNEQEIADEVEKDMKEQGFILFHKEGGHE